MAVIKTNGSESRGQGGSSKRRPDGLETHAREYYRVAHRFSDDFLIIQGCYILAVGIRHLNHGVQSSSP